MNKYLYQILMGASLATFVGAVGAQTYGDQPSSTGKNAPQNVQAQPSNTSTSGGDAPFSNADKNSPQAAPTQPSSPQAPTSGGDTPYSSTQTQPAAPSDQMKAPQPTRAEPAAPTAQMSGQANAQEQPSKQASRKMSSAKSSKPTQHAAKSHGKPEQTAMQGDKAYREALRQCAKEQDQNARESCLDNAIEHHRST